VTGTLWKQSILMILCRYDMSKDNAALLIMVSIILFAYCVPFILGNATITLSMLANQLVIIVLYSVLSRVINEES